ncbi:hypothetical protein SAMN04490248_1029 [Salinihabitans flavidus]|uniref:DUF883 domain-containing protein n=1 Tax=Salinihabitans flavidus TaxID=569882 RepID=A0A1H8MB76_9RHOB|nr:hypothetical protein [Salinihabitans flavidus]SEO14627.1 hypothetical protein SAMN04490248_1029 [Salinihabitans flavidus]
MNKSVTPDIKAATSPDDLSHQIEVLRADLAKLAATISDDVSEGIGKAGQQIGQSGRDARASATNAVIAHPLTSVGIAAAVGLLLGMISRKG